METLLSEVSLLKPDPETVSLVPPRKEPNSGEMLWISRMYSMVAFTLLLWNEQAEKSQIKSQMNHVFWLESKIDDMILSVLIIWIYVSVSSVVIWKYKQLYMNKKGVLKSLMLILFFGVHVAICYVSNLLRLTSFFVLFI